MANELTGDARNDAEAREEARAYTIEIFAAVLLGVATLFGAFAAYQSALWGGNSSSGYAHATNKLAEANREMLRAVQEQSFDAVVWIENMKARDAAKLAAAKQAEAETSEEEEEPAAEGSAPATEDQRAQEIVSGLSYTSTMTLEQKLRKLQKMRTHLRAGVQWANDRYKKQMAALSPKDKLDLAKRIMAYEHDMDVLADQQMKIFARLGMKEETFFDEDAVTAALARDPKAKAEYDEHERNWAATQRKIDHEYEKLAKPLFFESPEYVKKQEIAYKTLQAEGAKLLQQAETDNVTGDKFTRATVFFTITLFFAGIAAVLKRRNVKLALLSIATLVLLASIAEMFRLPLA